MRWPNKQQWLDAAEIVDAWRLFPRIYMLFFLLLLWDVHRWVTELAVAPPWYAQAVFGVLGVLFGLYLKSGRTWGGLPHLGHGQIGQGMMYGGFHPPHHSPPQEGHINRFLDKFRDQGVSG